MACAVALCVGVAVPTQAQSSATELAAGVQADVTGGYDSNPQLAVSPNARRQTVPESDAGPGSSAVAAAVVDAYGVWGRSAWFGLGAGGDFRAYHSGDARHDSALRAFGGVLVAAHELSLSAHVGRYDASFSLDDAWYGTLAPTLRLALSPTWSLGVEPRIGFRDYAQGAQTNVDLGGGADLQLRGSTWLARLGGDLDRRFSTDGDANRTQLVPFALFAWRVTDWALSMRLSMFARWFDAGAQDGLEHTAELQGRARLSSVLWLTSQIGFGVARGQQDSLSYERVTAMLGLSATWQREDDELPRSVDRTVQGPARVNESGTRFEVCHAGARSIAVIGTFNDWSAERGKLTESSPGCFVGELFVPAGRHRYQWLIDGEVVRPDSAPSYAADGFGGEDAVLVVPE